MVSLFKKPSTKQPAELVKNLRDALLSTSLTPEKQQKETTKYIGHMRTLIAASVPPPVGDGDDGAPPPPVDPAAENLVVILGNDICDSGLLSIIIQNLNKFDFEAKKDVVYVVNHLVRRKSGARYPTVDFLARAGQPIWFLLYVRMRSLISPQLLVPSCASVLSTSL